MELRSLGRSGLQVSEVGLGLAALGRPGYINLGHGGDLPRDHDPAAMEAHAHTMLDAAWAAGVRYVDVARSYGRGEEFLASWLDARGLEPGAVTVGSKWGYAYTAGWQVDAEVHEEKEHSVERLRQQVRESRARLGDHLQLYQVHSATLDSGALAPDVLDELARVKAAGLHIGLTTSGPDQAETIRAALEVERDGVPLFGTVQTTWNLLEQSAADALAEAHEAGVGVLVKEVVANGRLTARNDLDHDRAVIGQLTQEASAMGVTPDAVALNAARRQPWADVVLSGASTPDQLEHNLRHPWASAWQPDWPRWMLQYREDPEEYWRVRATLPWN